MNKLSIMLFLCFCAGQSFASERRADTVVLSPGDDIQAAVDAHGPNTAFTLSAGLYRLQSVQPKNGDMFLGETGAVLNGAKLLTDFDGEGGLFVARGQPIDPNTTVQGVCRKGFPRCGHPQDLYFDGHPLRAVAKLSKVTAGTFFYDYAHDAVYFADDPSGHIVEVSYRPFAFGGAARDVEIRNLTIENYACADQQGAIGDHGAGKSWHFQDDEVRWNHGVGIVMAPGSQAMHNFVHHNGELGIGAGGGDGTISDSEIAFNVWNGTDCGWECGGVKWAQVTEWFVLNNHVHDNQGDGLWADIDAEQMLFEGNLIENNLLAGISIEISHSVVIHANTFKGNGAKSFGWGWDGQVQIQNSSAVNVVGNTLVLDRRRGGNGIIIIQQKRGARHMPRTNKITGNDITMAGGEGAVVGWFADYKPDAFAKSGNLFDNNRYHVYAPGADFWAPNEWTSFPAWQATGQDAHSTVDGTP